MRIQRQCEAFAYRIAAQWPGEPPSSAPFPSEEEFERVRQRDYPRGYGPPLQGEDDPHYMDPEGASLDDSDPERFLSDPGFSEGRPSVAPHYDDYDQNYNDWEYEMSRLSKAASRRHPYRV